MELFEFLSVPRRPPDCIFSVLLFTVIHLFPDIHQTVSSQCWYSLAVEKLLSLM